MMIQAVTIDDIYHAMDQNHKRYDHRAIRKAWEYMKQKHQGVTRVSGEPYSQHPLRVALLVAEWGFESSVVIAALLHDVVEDTETSLSEIKDIFGTPVKEMVDAVTKVRKALDDREKLPKSEQNRQSDVKFLDTVDDRSLFIKVADRIDNLSTIDVMPPEKQILKAVHTREIIIPTLKLEGAYRLVDELESLCFRIEHREQYEAILSKVAQITAVNERSIRETLTLMKHTFLNSGKASSLSKYSEGVAEFSWKKRSPISLFRQISRNASRLRDPIDQYLSKKDFAFYDLTLIVKEDLRISGSPMSAADLFFRFYDAVFLDRGIVIEDICKTSYEDATYLLLHDERNNRYRLFIRTQSEYLQYCLGDSMKDISEFPWQDVDVLAPASGTFKKKIKVFTRNGESRYIDEDASVLDFAFLIHSDLGLSFSYALVNSDSSSNRIQVPAHRRLNYGDRVEIVTSSDVEPQLSWFKYVKTTRAVYHLVRYFENRFKVLQSLNHLS